MLRQITVAFRPRPGGQLPLAARTGFFIRLLLLLSEPLPAGVTSYNNASAIPLAAIRRVPEADLAKTLTIRGEVHTVLQALHRSLTHTAYHTGQIVYLSRLMKTDGWEWLTIPPGQSKQLGDRGKKYLQ